MFENNVAFKFTFVSENGLITVTVKTSKARTVALAVYAV